MPQEEKLLPIDICAEFAKHHDDIRNAYHLQGQIYFKKIKRGMTYESIYAYQLNDDSEEIPVGIFKEEIHSQEIADSRFAVLAKMASAGFDAIPKIFKNQAGSYLTKIGAKNYFLMESLKSDPEHPENKLGLREMLSLTDHYHAYSQSVSADSALKISRHEMHLSRQDVINEIDQLGIDPEILHSESWQRLLRLYRFFASEEAKNIFAILPQQIINGDNHHQNLTFSAGKPYFIHFDSLRYDLRLYDITSFIRHGRSEHIRAEFLSAVKSGTLNDVFEECYGKKASPLTKLELQEFPLILGFSFVESFSWILNRIKQEGLTADYAAYIKTKLASFVEFLDLKLLDEKRFVSVSPLRKNSMYAASAEISNNNETMIDAIKPVP